MDYTYSDKDIILEIEQYMNDKGEALISRMKYIIDKFEVYKTKKTEEDFKMEFTPVLMDVANAIGVEFNPKYEKYVKSGRMDCFYNCIDLEYKVPGAIEPQNVYFARKSMNDSYLEEVHRQIEGYSIKEKVDKRKILGIIFDGKRIIYTYYLTTDWHNSVPQEVNESSMEKFLKRLFSSNIKGKAVCVSNLIEDFGVDSELSKSIVKCFYNKLNECENCKTKIMFDQWKSLFREVSGYNEETLKLDIGEIVETYNFTRSNIVIDHLIFAIQTYYAMFIKLLVTEMLNQKKMKVNINTQMNFSSKDCAYKELQNIENGQLFVQFGINNFIENDFFGWYLDEWDTEIYDEVKQLLRKIGDYNFYETTNLDDSGSQDLLRKLYNYLMPKSLRHALGEYYSPDWLAQRTYNEVGINGDIQKSILDPTCGSGTFIVIAIKKMIETNKGKTPDEELLKHIIENVHGFDLNPLAVITARANYLLALGDLINDTSCDIEIPIYHCDAMLTILEENREDHYVKKIATRAGIFEIPKEFCVHKTSFFSLLDELRKGIIKQKDFEKELWIEISKKFKVDAQDLKLKELTLNFYQQLAILNKKGILNVWLQIIKNAFIPLFHKKVDFLIGNPPWVNWQTLPEDYRESIHKHWYEYKIFDFTGLKARLGNAHDDISVLLTYVVMDNFLKDNGTLAFIINQNLLQAYGGGEGFRKFLIKGNTPVKVIKVDDFVLVEPFLSLGASNRTAVIYMKKGEKTIYPVQYNKWYKLEKGIIDAEDTLMSVLTKVDFTSLIAEPVNNIYNSSWMIGTEEQLEIFSKMQGKCNYLARKGVDTSANGIYWVEVLDKLRGKVIIRNTPENSKKAIPQFNGAIEEKYLYPLVRGKDIHKWKYVTPYKVIIPYEENMKKPVSKDTFQSESENLYKYFYDSNFNPNSEMFLQILTSRGIYKKHYENVNVPEYVLYNIGEYTSAPYKVVWKALASKGMEACVISSEKGKLIIPDHNNVMVPFEDREEAYYFCAIVNSKLIGEFIDSYISWFKSNHILENISIPNFIPENSVHHRLAILGEQAHVEVKNKNKLKKIEEEIERTVKLLFL